MQRKLLVATVAAIPLLAFAHGALAETTITTALTAPVKTSDTTPDDSVRVTNTGSIRPTVAGPVLEMDTDHSITNEGTLSTTDLNDTAGMQSTGGLTGSIVNKGTISILEDYTPTDTDPPGDEAPDGDLDGPFAKAGSTGRYGIRVTQGTGLLTGSITNDTTGGIIVEGNDSYGIRLEAGLTGTLMHRGSISVTGDDGHGIRTEGDIGGALEVRGSVSVLGENSVGVSVEGDVDGLFRIQGAVVARGYRSASSATPTNEAFAKLDDDDLLLGGPAVKVSGDIGGGILIDSARPADASTTDTDEDDDGIPDAEEGAGGSISVLGSAPALQIGDAAGSITVGAVGTGDSAYGLINKGSITAAGVYADYRIDTDPDVYRDHPAVALMIGPNSASTATLAGGLRNEGSITATATDADATGIRLTTGAQLGLGGVGGVIVNTGSIGAQTTALNGVGGVAPPSIPGVEEANTARALSIEAGAFASALNNTGTISALSSGERGSAIAVQDASGTLRTITNTYRILAQVLPNDDASDIDDTNTDPSDETITGSDIAIDVSAATLGVTITQNGVDDGDDGDDDIDDLDGDDDGVDDADEPVIFGDVRFGSGDDLLQLNNGRMIGDVSFGAGTNTFTLDGGAAFAGWITGTDVNPNLTINVTEGQLALTEIDDIHASTLNVGADSSLFVTINADNTDSTRLVVDTATFAEGAQIGVQVEGLIDFETFAQTRNYVIVDATTLDAGDLDDSLLTLSPYIYDISTDADEAADTVTLRVGRRAAEEIGFNAAQTSAYDAVYAALLEDEEIRGAILAQTNREGFLDLYNQFLPDQLEGLFSALEMAQLSIGRAVATKPDLRQRYGPDSFWLQELNLQVKRDGEESLGSESKGFGFVAGYESMGDDGGALGATLAYINAEETDDAAKVGEQTTVSQLEVGAYWRRAAGSWLFSVRGGGGYAWFDGTRRFLTPGQLVNNNGQIAVINRVIREGTAEWNGLTGSLHASAAYDTRFGRFYARPTLAMDYFYLREGEREETGAGAFNQTVEERTSSRLSGTAEMAFGAEFGREVWWRPEIRAGYRYVLAGEIGDTVASFNGGSSFLLAASNPGDGAAILALALKMGTPMSYLAIEGEAELADGEQRYNLQLIGRVMF